MASSVENLGESEAHVKWLESSALEIRRFSNFAHFARTRLRIAAIAIMKVEMSRAS